MALLRFKIILNVAKPWIHNYLFGREEERKFTLGRKKNCKCCKGYV